MAVELGPHGIRVNAVAPGPVLTARTRALGGDAAEKRWREWLPLGRAIEPDELASAVLFLISDCASAITGQLLVVDAGCTAISSMGPLEYFSAYAGSPIDTSA